MVGSKKVHPQVDDMLTRIARTGMADQQVQQLAGLPSGWLSQARSGRYGPSADSVKKAARWIDRWEAAREKGEAKKAKAATEAPPEPSRISSTVAEKLGESAHAAKTAKQLDLVARELSRAIARGEIELDMGDAVLQVLKERRQLLKARREERAQRQVQALEILTPGDLAAIAAHRAKEAGAPLQPGEAVPPPITAPA